MHPSTNFYINRTIARCKHDMSRANYLAAICLHHMLQLDGDTLKARMPE